MMPELLWAYKEVANGEAYYTLYGKKTSNVYNGDGEVISLPFPDTEKYATKIMAVELPEAVLQTYYRLEHGGNYSAVYNILRARYDIDDAFKDFLATVFHGCTFKKGGVAEVQHPQWQEWNINNAYTDYILIVSSNSYGCRYKNGIAEIAVPADASTWKDDDATKVNRKALVFLYRRAFGGDFEKKWEDYYTTGCFR